MSQSEQSRCHDIITNDFPVVAESFPRDYFFTRHVLKPKNVYRPRCLKRKLKKYKLRTDGQEDLAILNISREFLSTLKIKSPQKGNFILNNNIGDIDDIWPRNYLFKMARRKLKVKPESSTASKHVQDTIETSPTNSQIKKQTNAFKLLMDSRNKSIGTNSPGKEKVDDPLETQEKLEKKSVKVKRNLALQKMAESKGAIKKKELEEHEKKCIAKKMEERAERLKNMLVSPPPSSSIEKLKEVPEKNKSRARNCDKVLVVKENEDITIINTNKTHLPNGVTKKSNTLQIINMFDKEKLCKSPEKKLAKEDKEFLKKLSPSIRKKENMLCYFKKIEKASESVIIENVDDNEESDSPIIKVRIKTKDKKKQKHKRLSLKKESLTEILKDHNENNPSKDCSQKINSESVVDNTDKEQPTGNKRRKRKRKEVIETVAQVNSDTTDCKESVTVEEGRPRRNVKRPMKYTDDILLSSSDEEIFSSKKRKHIEKTPSRKSKTNSTNEIVVSDDEDAGNNKRKVKDIKTNKKPTKLAPIFAVKPLPNLAELEAKQKFLYSGIPEQLRKVIDQQKCNNLEFVETFPIVVHIQQEEKSKEFSTKEIPLLFSPETDRYQDEPLLENDLDNIIAKLINLSSELNDSKAPKHESDIQKVLKDMKELHPKFPVYRTYRLLRSRKKGDFKDTNIDLENSVDVETSNDPADEITITPESRTWTNKYKATSTKHLIGNFDAVKELKNWLIPWTESGSTKKNDSDSSDFYDSDSNSRDSMSAMKNLLVLTGPVGSGKTSTVYAAANELKIKVIEVNASSKRTGRLMMQDLQEATQSHKVNRGPGSSENSQKSQDFDDGFVLKTKKKGRPKKPAALLKKACSTEANEITSSGTGQESSRTALSLILIDDADIIFDQDDGFSAAIAQLIQFSKRPVILICASLTCPHLQRFYSCGNILRMQPLLPRILGTWLDIMGLADSGLCWPGLGAKILDDFKGDIRKTINNLHFFMASQKQANDGDSQNTDCKAEIEDENSNMSWPEHETENRISLSESTNANEAYNCFVGKTPSLLQPHVPMDLLDVWWSIPSLIPALSSPIETAENERQKSNLLELEAISDLMDAISISDHICHSESRENITSQPWFSATGDSVSEQENFEGYDRCRDVTNDIVGDLVRSTILETQRILDCGNETVIHSPNMAALRDKDRKISRHDSFTSFVNPSSALDRRALALDYWPSCRQICRTEKDKIDTVSKRHNRYLHYLKSYNVTCKNDSFNRLGDSLS